MKVVFLSLTGNVKNFAERTELDLVELPYSNPFIRIGEPYVLIVPTYDNDVEDFHRSFIDFKDNSRWLKGIAGSGNLNFGKEYCFSAIALSVLYMKPLISTFELAGTANDLLHFKKEVEKLEIA